MKMKGKGMSSPKGMYSYSKNPLKNASMTRSGKGQAMGSPANSDQMKVCRLMKKAHAEKESLRGKNSI